VTICARHIDTDYQSLHAATGKSDQTAHEKCGVRVRTVRNLCVHFAKSWLIISPTQQLAQRAEKLNFCASSMPDGLVRQLVAQAKGGF
jgi:hypothetical protein